MPASVNQQLAFCFLLQTSSRKTQAPLVLVSQPSHFSKVHVAKWGWWFPVAEPGAPIRSGAGLYLHMGRASWCSPSGTARAVWLHWGNGWCCTLLPSPISSSFSSSKSTNQLFPSWPCRVLPHGGELRHLDTDRLVCVSPLHSFGLHSLAMLFSPLGWGSRL